MTKAEHIKVLDTPEKVYPGEKTCRTCTHSDIHGQPLINNVPCGRCSKYKNFKKITGYHRLVIFHQSLNLIGSLETQRKYNKRISKNYEVSSKETEELKREVEKYESIVFGYRSDDIRVCLAQDIAEKYKRKAERL